MTVPWRNKLWKDVSIIYHNGLLWSSSTWWIWHNQTTKIRPSYGYARSIEAMFTGLTLRRLSDSTSGSKSRSKNVFCCIKSKYSIFKILATSMVTFKVVITLTVQAYVYSTSSGQCAAFLLNNNTRETVQVVFRDSSYNLLPKSVSILPDCKTVVFNTATVYLWNSNKLFCQMSIY